MKRLKTGLDLLHIALHNTVVDAPHSQNLFNYLHNDIPMQFSQTLVA